MAATFALAFVAKDAFMVAPNVEMAITTSFNSAAQH